MPNFRDPGHLPNLREGGKPPEPSWLPRQRRGTTPQMIGRYPDYDVLANAGNWDQVTRKVVLDRLEPPGPLRFFTKTEGPTLRAFCDTFLAQDHEPRIPVAAMVDQALADGRLDGYQYRDMPDDGATWRQVLVGLDQGAREAGCEDFAQAPEKVRQEVVGRFAKAELDPRLFGGLNVRRSFSVCARMAVTAFYSHPFAWNEIGFGGPAYPRCYMRTGPVGIREPHEAPAAAAEDPAPVVADWRQ